MIKTLISAMEKKGHAVFQNDSKPFNLNYVGVRDMSEAGKWNDTFIMFWKYNGVWNQFVRQGTTDPGLYYLHHPLNVKGTAILKQGQYRGAWTIGKHQSKYDALVQRKEVTVIRDADRDSSLDIVGGLEDTGFHGINHHRAMSKKDASKVGRFSAGCQVTLNPHEYDVFMSICGEAEEIWGKGITYTLININDL